MGPGGCLAEAMPAHSGRGLSRPAPWIPPPLPIVQPQKTAPRAVAGAGCSQLWMPPGPRARMRARAGRS